MIYLFSCDQNAGFVKWIFFINFYLYAALETNRQAGLQVKKRVYLRVLEL